MQKVYRVGRGPVILGFLGQVDLLQQVVPCILDYSLHHLIYEITGRHCAPWPSPHYIGDFFSMAVYLGTTLIQHKTVCVLCLLPNFFRPNSLIPKPFFTLSFLIRRWYGEAEGELNFIGFYNIFTD